MNTETNHGCNKMNGIHFDLKFIDNFTNSINFTITCRIDIDLFKMFSHWIWGIFNVQIQSEKGTNSCKLFVILKLQTYLKFISGVVVHSVCHY